MNLSGPIRPGASCEGGREKPHASECRSKLPYLPYQKFTSMSNADFSPKRARAARQQEFAQVARVDWTGWTRKPEALANGSLATL
jgi:hypothetical protein